MNAVTVPPVNLGTEREDCRAQRGKRFRASLGANPRGLSKQTYRGTLSHKINAGHYLAVTLATFSCFTPTYKHPTQHSDNVFDPHITILLL